MKRINWLYKFAMTYIRTFRPKKVYHPLMPLYVIFTFLLLLTRGIYLLSLIALGLTLGLVFGRYIIKKLNQIIIIWSVYYIASHYKMED